MEITRDCGHTNASAKTYKDKSLWLNGAERKIEDIPNEKRSI